MGLWENTGVMRTCRPLLTPWEAGRAQPWEWVIGFRLHTFPGAPGKFPGRAGSVGLPVANTPSSWGNESFSTTGYLGIHDSTHFMGSWSLGCGCGSPREAGRLKVMGGKDKDGGLGTSSKFLK